MLPDALDILDFNSFHGIVICSWENVKTSKHNESNVLDPEPRWLCTVQIGNYVPNYVLNYVIYGCGLTFASTYAQSAIIIMNDIFIALVEIFLTCMAL